HSLHADTPPVAVVDPTIPSSYADLHYSKALNAIVAVQEVQSDTDAQNQNRIVAFSLDQPEPFLVQVLAQGADFYAAPCLSETGDRFAWLQWNHPDMPWDSSRLLCADISTDNGALAVKNIQPIAGDEASSVCQPGFLKNGDLLFAMDLADDSGGAPDYWNLYRSDGDCIASITQDRSEYGEAHWVFGQQRWVQTGESRVLAIATREEADYLIEIDLASGARRSLGEACARLSQLSEHSGIVNCIAEYTDKPAQIIEILPEGKVNCLSSPVPWLAESETAQPQLIRYPTRDGEHAYANFYPASNPVSEQTTALLVLVHGGPTARSGTALSPLVQYFAQNGFSVLDVNHRGSTGHGRAYRQALLSEWGEIDANDIADAVEFVVSERGVDAGRVFIRGGSAGGYAVLRALTRFPELFCGGACYYGIGNLITLSEITHKFEARYTDQLIGECYTPESAALPESRFRSRSPIFDIDKIKSPLILFQGLEDKVVPPEVSAEMVQTLAHNGVEHEYIEYPGEGHGFRKAETKIDALGREIAFYKAILRSF
ncbi:MAG: S9 family peptidase, partial [Proteobacteria bacterium]|nr:S9 family peptidase [Pseudomonadota bacterium]